MPPQSGGSRRVRYGAKPFDQETNAFIRRLSPRSANPACWNCGARTPPPGWMMLTGKAFGISIQRSKHHFTDDLEALYVPVAHAATILIVIELAAVRDAPVAPATSVPVPTAVASTVKPKSADGPVTSCLFAVVTAKVEVPLVVKLKTLNGPVIPITSLASPAIVIVAPTGTVKIFPVAVVSNGVVSVDAPSKASGVVKDALVAEQIFPDTNMLASVITIAVDPMAVVKSAALAAGADTTENTPAVSADTATSAMRFLIVFIDIFFLSLVELGNFPISA